MERRTVLFWLTSALALSAPGTAALADKGRGRGGDDDGGGSDDSGGSGGHGGDDDGSDDHGGDDGGNGGGDDGGGSGSGGSSGPGGNSGPSGHGAERPTEVDADTLVIRFSNGSAESIRNGRYQRTDSGGRVVESRPATRQDRARMAVARPGRGQEMVIRIDSRRGEVETTDRRGWRELIAHGTYLLTDPNGNVVNRRAVRQGDMGRIIQLAGG